MGNSVDLNNLYHGHYQMKKILEENKEHSFPQRKSFILFTLADNSFDHVAEAPQTASWISFLEKKIVLHLKWRQTSRQVWVVITHTAKTCFFTQKERNKTRQDWPWREERRLKIISIYLLESWIPSTLEDESKKEGEGTYMQSVCTIVSTIRVG